MSAGASDYEAALDRAVVHAKDWLQTVAERPVGPRESADAALKAFGFPLPDTGSNPVAVIDELARGAEPGLMAIGSGRFFGWVMGGTLPAALAADWLVSAWDQNAGLRFATPAAVAIEEAAASWILELLGLPATADVGFVTGGTMANFVGLAAARATVLSRAGWDVNANGLNGAPPVHVLAGAERHDTIDLTLRYLGLGRPQLVTADNQGRIVVPAMAAALEAIPSDAPTIVCLQAGNVHSGAFDPFDEAIALAHKHGAWVHVDGAFGLWAAISPSLRHLTRGFEGADSWATDAHKTLNVPYDCGIAIVAEPSNMRPALGAHAAYLISDANPGPGDPLEKVPEFSRRARGVPVWASLRSLGREGAVGLVDGFVEQARAIAQGIEAIEGAEVLNDVVYTQVCVAFGDDERTRAVTQRIIDSGTAWMSGSRWRERDILRISVSNWATNAEDVRRSIEAVRQAIEDERGDKANL